MTSENTDKKTANDPDKTAKKRKILALSGIAVAVCFFLMLANLNIILPFFMQKGEISGLDVASGSDSNLPPILISGRALGEPKAPVKVVEYSSLTCGHCAHFHKDTLPAIKEKYISTGQVYFQFEDFPLNAPALQASLIARCLPENRYIGFVDLLFKTQDTWALRADYIVPLTQDAKLAGLGEDGVEACLENKKIRNEIADAIKHATGKWNIRSTPSFIISGPEGEEVLEGAQPLYEFERVFRKVSGGAVAPLETENKE
ncbi:MAG: DsbA family protein [Rhodospirillales bacterium]|nr:DsbA family protein [Alphaproteobacteria bacterium]USO03237.1 MAG: DsbA family protein [Rhodospirillales bacterium]